ncbi:putative cationic amino acid transporter [Cavenderia fasciculata]|uniref:Cationic amino acid transporter n=1 Tax=Cavenderia fasciculata TaxID=261658 RepID=F4Q0M1_CACFS|nr:putative cationic amino acid transporter [Cavenderia fasciculata]EGG18372.1 putative cationic amino acid transporter [Cavenderia fasciculata]|eukprot:XP_004366276.1 putative cationic amino acid transporter [Cavenderia fasciculata]
MVTENDIRYRGDTTPLINTEEKKESVYSYKSLVRKYPVNLDEDTELDKCLTIVDIISYGVGSTVGAGVFVSIGIAISGFSGPGTALSFIFSAIACLISAFCYSEFAARIPLSGSAYTFAYVALGEYAGWFIGWNLTLEYAISASAVARGWSGYFSEFFKIFNKATPEWVTGYNLNDYFSIAPLSPVIIIICTGILVFGVKDSARFNLSITILNITTILFFIIFGAFYVDISNLNPFLPYGMNGVFQGCSRIFFSYVGFDSVTTLSGEVKNPKRDLPVGIVATLGIATVLYVGVTIVLSGMIKYLDVSHDSPLSDAFLSLATNHPHLKWVAFVLVIGTLTSLTASTLCSLLGQPRIYLQMAKDGLFFQQFASVNKKTQVPVFGTIFTGAFASVLAILLNLDQLTNMISIGTLLAFTVVCAGVVVVRLSDEQGNEEYRLKSPILLFVLFVFACLFGVSSANSWNWGYQVGFSVPMIAVMVALSLRRQLTVPTTFKCPLSPVLPCLGIIVNTYFIMHLDTESFYRVIIWTVVGSIIYFAYGIRNSKLNNRINGGSQKSVN